ncbi:MAG: SpoIIE family protein phosphatase [Clostridia bacterium]|nr:SpoIIE family protein phosphatase [Clostridia bacterium]
MTSTEFLRLAAATLLPVFATAIFYILEKKTAFGRINYWVRQIIVGVFFGGIAVLGTEYGVPTSGGAVVNSRDASVLAAGLMFGAPAGIIAGIIGGVERWFAVYWGVGSFTRLACSVSTIIAGLYSAFLRKAMFENKKPGWLLSLAIGAVMETLHLTMVFITNMATPLEAMEVVRACTAPMIAINSLSVMLSAMILSLLGQDRKRGQRNYERISQTIQKWLLVSVLLAFAATSYFVFSFQTRLAATQCEESLDLAIAEIKADIRDASDQNLLTTARNVRADIATESLDEALLKYSITEISIIERKDDEESGTSTGIIVESTNPSYIGFDMNSGEQAREFLCLLEATGPDFYTQGYGPITSDEAVSRKYAGIKFHGGFIQLGYDAEALQADLSKTVKDITKNRHVGQSGVVLIYDSALTLVSAPENYDQNSIDRTEFEALAPKEDSVFSAKVKNEDCYVKYSLSEGYYIVSAMPKTEALRMRNIALYVNTFMEILVFAILFALIYQLIKTVVVNRIKSVNSSLAKIAGGDLNEVVNVRSNEEFASLSDDINSTVDTLKRYIAEASARVDKELELAKNIQSSALPSTFPAFPKRSDFDIFAAMYPAKEVGGDFYDFYMTNDDKLHFLIADVSGKGIGAAMFMMRAKTELKSLTEAGMPIEEVFTAGNHALCEGNDAGMFVTAWQGGIDLENGLVRFSNAGHNPPLIKHRDGAFEYLRSRTGLVLAGMDGLNYKSQELRLEPGDTVFLYTDGVTEATNANNELFGEDRLLTALNSKKFGSSKEICDFIKKSVDEFVGDAPQFDDITMLAFDYSGTGDIHKIEFEQGKIDDIPAVQAFAEEKLEKLGAPMKVITQIDIAIDEIYSNIIKHGYAKAPGPVLVSLRQTSDKKGITLRFVDEGVPYNPLTKEAPDITLSAEERKIGGLGIYMVKKTMDDMRYRYENDKNILTLTKYFE